MSEARMGRMEDMMHQLIGMVGTVVSSQNVMKEDITVMKEDITVMKEDIVVMKNDISEIKVDIIRLNERVDRVCYQHETSFQYLNAKVSQHDHDIYVLQKAQI